MSFSAPDSRPVGLITVRLRSTRLPRKCLLEFGGSNLLEHVIDRAARVGFRPVVATTDQPDDDRIAEIAAERGCACFRGDERDKLRRWRDACRELGIEDFHTVDADDPFFDGDLGQASIALLRRGGYDVVHPSSRTYLASVGFSLTRDVIERACAIKTSDDTEMMWYYLEAVRDLRGIELPVNDARIREVRLTLDYEEDYWLLRTVLRILGPDAKRREIEQLFLDNPQLRLVNWFRNDEWKRRQENARPGEGRG